MTDTIREQIISDIATQADDIRTVNGYNTDCGANVQRVRHNLDPDELPAAVIWPQSETTERIHGKILCTMPVRVEGLMAFGSNNPSEVSEQILGDLIKMMTDPSDKPTALAEDIFYAGGGTDEYPEEGQLSVGASAVFNIKYKTLIGNPYSQS